MAYAPIPVLKDVPRYPTRSDGERLDELMQAALNGGSDMVAALNKDFIPRVNAVIPTLDVAAANITAIIAAPEKANQAAASATAAAGSASSASGSATTATNAKTAAEAAKTAAQGSATSAAGSAATANTKAGEASASATSASGSAATATTAKNAAELAKTQAEAAKTAAQGSATAAAGSATTANTAKTAAETAKTAAQTAESNALASKNAASASATNAATSETNANASKNAAAGSATAANTAKTAAEAANTAAQTAKTGAENAKTQADAAKTAAAGSATAAKASETESAAILKKVEDAEIGIFPPATSTTAGVVTLSSAIDSPSETEAATPCAVQKAADLAKAAKVSSESWTLTAAVPANGQITLPRGYIVGAKEMMLFKGGMLVNYADIGTPGKWSTVCKLTDGAASGDVMTMVGALETAPSVVLDFEGGAWPKELVCTRATVDYVFDDNGKVQEVPANTPAITKDPVTGRKGLQIFRQRTRLNKYYKTAGNGSPFAVYAPHGTAMSNVVDQNSPTGVAVRGTYTKSAHTSGSSDTYVRYDIKIDLGTTPITVSKRFVITACVKCDVPILLKFRAGVAPAGAPHYSDNFEVTNAYSVHTFTMNVPVACYFDNVKIMCDRLLVSNFNLDIAYIQIEESAVPTPLIAGPEGQQVTVGGVYVKMPQLINYNNNNKTTVLYSRDRQPYHTHGSNNMGIITHFNDSKEIVITNVVNAAASIQLRSNFSGSNKYLPVMAASDQTGKYWIAGMTYDREKDKCRGIVNGYISSPYSLGKLNFDLYLTWISFTSNYTSGNIYNSFVYTNILSDYDLSILTAITE